MEIILIRTIGGPLDGESRVMPLSVFDNVWPPPERLDPIPETDGLYVRESYSKLPPMEEDSPVKRGAQYKWVEL